MTYEEVENGVLDIISDITSKKRSVIDLSEPIPAIEKSLDDITTSCQEFFGIELDYADTAEVKTPNDLIKVIFDTLEDMGLVGEEQIGEEGGD